MATLSRTARVRLDDTATHTTTFLQFVATAAVEQTPEGGSVVITTERSVQGATPPGNPNTLTLRLVDDTGTQIVSFTLNPTAASQTSTFHFTSTGAAGGAARHGTVEIVLRATRTDAVAYDVESDGAPNTQPAGFDSHFDRGYIIGTTTKVHAFSNVAAGGAKTEPAEYDESLFLRVTLGSASYVARALSTTLSAGSLSANTNSTTSATRDASFANVVDDRFPAAVTEVTATVTAPNATLTGLPYTVFTSTTADSINVDPRLTASHHFQVDDNAFALSKHDASKSMLSTSSGFLATRFVTARTAAGVNGLVVTQTLTPVGPGTAVTGSSATATRDSQAGWSDLLAWVSSKPGGSWNKTTDITTPADIDADTHIIGGTDAYVMLAPDPRIVLRGYMNKSDTERRHFTAGDSVVVSMTVVDLTTRVRIDPARVTEPAASFIRYVSATDRLETLGTDGIWSLWEPTAAAALFALSPSPNDTRNYIRAFTDTTTWTRDVMAILFTCKVDGTPYSGFQSREEVGGDNNHDGYALDPVALALSGVLSFR